MTKFQNMHDVQVFMGMNLPVALSFQFSQLDFELAKSFLKS